MSLDPCAYLHFVWTSTLVPEWCKETLLEGWSLTRCRLFRALAACAASARWWRFWPSWRFGVKVPCARVYVCFAYVVFALCLCYACFAPASCFCVCILWCDQHRCLFNEHVLWCRFLLKYVWKEWCWITTLLDIQSFRHVSESILGMRSLNDLCRP